MRKIIVLAIMLCASVAFGNYAFKTDMTAENGTVFKRENFCQVMPGTEIFKGVTGLTFDNCNLINCKVPADAIVKECNTSQISFCSHQHPEFVNKGLPVCVTECSHMVDKTEIRIDGVLIDTTYTYEDKPAQ